MRRYSYWVSARAATTLSAAARGLCATPLWLGTIIPYKLADIGEGITEVQVIDVCVKPGDLINEFDQICEVQSDKATVDITSRYSGVVTTVHITKGATARVGQALVDIELTDDADAAAAKPSPIAKSADPIVGNASSDVVATPYKLADIGEGIREVQVLSVSVKEGDNIEEFDKICEVQSDKATVDITSRYSGVVSKVYVKQGETAQVGQTLVDIKVAGGASRSAEAVPASMTTPQASQSGAPVTSLPQWKTDKVQATPATRHLAKLYSIDLSRVTATGKGGRVTKEDVMAYVASGGASPAATAAVPNAPSGGGAQPRIAAAAAAVKVGEHSGIPLETGDQVIAITGVRRGMVKTMSQAATIPTFGFSEEYDLTQLMSLRASLKGAVEKRSGGKTKLSFMPFFLKAASLVLREFPDINAHCPVDCSALVRKKSHNIGFAMDTPNGLIVPVIKQVELKSIYDIATDMQALIDKGRQNRLARADMEGGTFSLSNIGAIGATYTSPVILPPQVAIGAIGRLQKLPRFDSKGNMYTANIVVISFTADHRVIDGATMVRYANRLKQFLEYPEDMLLDMH